MRSSQWQPCFCAVVAALLQVAHTSAVPVIPSFTPPLPNYHKPLGGLDLLPNTENYLIYEASVESGTYR